VTRKQWAGVRVTDVLIVMLQFQYLTRKPLRARESFFDKMYGNIRRCGFDPRSEGKLIAMAFRAAGQRRNHPARIGICFEAMDLIGELVEHGMRLTRSS